ncbi:flagellar basal body-associated protein FliL [Halomonas mongoliensis]|uniref:Flagellar protein FliL n=1 Tax=Halomonas mongoliensis TaxID=321265 RepID=A0ABU1GMU9_9GAMM|nr:flagellar basal body-associated protein FliL [Halomonas mongoliensis]MDR5893351.1 flagellar basal body-associated protein FliL [Halomonas mongoliensis]
MAKTGGGSSKLLWLMAILVVVSLSAAGATLYMMMGKGEHHASQAQAAPERRAPIFVKIDPFTVNLADDVYGSRLLYTGISLKVGDHETRDILKEHMPQVRSRLLLLFSGQQASELSQPDGKVQLAAKVMATLHEPMTEHQPDLDIEAVLFTEFIVQ